MSKEVELDNTILKASLVVIGLLVAAVVGTLKYIDHTSQLSLGDIVMRNYDFDDVEEALEEAEPWEKTSSWKSSLFDDLKYVYRVTGASDTGVLLERLDEDCLKQQLLLASECPTESEAWLRRYPNSSGISWGRRTIKKSEQSGYTVVTKEMLTSWFKQLQPSEYERLNK